VLSAVTVKLMRYHTDSGPAELSLRSLPVLTRTTERQEVLTPNRSRRPYSFHTVSIIHVPFGMKLYKQIEIVQICLLQHIQEGPDIVSPVGDHLYPAVRKELGDPFCKLRIFLGESQKKCEIIFCRDIQQAMLQLLPHGVIINMNNSKNFHTIPGKQRKKPF